MEASSAATACRKRSTSDCRARSLRCRPDRSACESIPCPWMDGTTPDVCRQFEIDLATGSECPLSTSSDPGPGHVSRTISSQDTERMRMSRAHLWQFPDSTSPSWARSQPAISDRSVVPAPNPWGERTAIATPNCEPSVREITPSWRTRYPLPSGPQPPLKRATLIWPSPHCWLEVT